MIKKISISVLVFVSLVSVFLLSSQKSQIIPQHVEKMPIVIDDPYAYLAFGSSPIEQREEKYRKWLSVSLKIVVSLGSGSGTIVYYDEKDGYAYIQSCGHLWKGNMTAQEGKSKKVTCDVIVWYHNGLKLNKPLKYSAEVLYYSNERGKDCSLLRFKPNWTPLYIPIASEFEFVQNTRFHSCGCDRGTEVAHYDVKYLGDKIHGDIVDLFTTENSPRPGRSGGGLFSDNLFVGVCWGTTDVSGEGNGLFTPLTSIKKLNEKNGYGWLNEAGISWARQIPIIDRNNPQGTYPPDYIPIPKN